MAMTLSSCLPRYVCAATGVMLAVAVALLVALAPVTANETPFKPFALDIDAIDAAISRERPAVPPEIPLTGITVPHHLLAADLIARGFWAASASRPSRVIVLLPDHFKKTRRPFATTARNFATARGILETDQSAAEALIARTDFFERSDLFQGEHGLQALLPYIAYFYPGTRIVPVAISIQSTRQDWDAAFPALLSLITDDTLVVQSTDFSHYLPPHKARQRDQETLNILSAGALETLVGLRQPAHLDSLGSQYLQMRLQKARFGASPLVIANANSQAYFQWPVNETTSYIVQLYCRPAKSTPPCGWREPASVYFAGDTLLGRNFARFLANDAVSSALVHEVRSVTGGAPMILNVEGVVTDEVPSRDRGMGLVMPVRATLQLLSELNVVAVSLANNHTMDLGREAYRDMADTFSKAGIAVLSHGETKAVGPLWVVALTDLSNTMWPRINRIAPGEIAGLSLGDAGPAKPVVAFLHWGEEGNASARVRELAIAEELRQQSVVAAVGSHPHIASQEIFVLGGGEMQMLPSLGNFLFDQVGPAASGALLEVRAFPQGTIFTRLIALPNLYQLAIDISPR